MQVDPVQGAGADQRLLQTALFPLTIVCFVALADAQVAACKAQLRSVAILRDYSNDEPRCQHRLHDKGMLAAQSE
ncbi:hypothetical protein SAMN05421881_10531 [Nitrosomonas halophila]|uniref:Uncharacterized protein n=1 Tax=Nitrosomonas halophila TaxID=44576 RepID=A0A1H3LTJ3_9PROT|nr:hypothetical protein SAMN05421881_10531 [Nitrosomonas halophila]